MKSYAQMDREMVAKMRDKIREEKARIHPDTKSSWLSGYESNLRAAERRLAERGVATTVSADAQPSTRSARNEQTLPESQRLAAAGGANDFALKVLNAARKSRGESALEKLPNAISMPSHQPNRRPTSTVEANDFALKVSNAARKSRGEAPLQSLPGA